MERDLSILLAVLALLPDAPSAGAAPPPPPHTGCAEELVAISPCLPYVAASPNNESSAPSQPCCEVFSSYAFDGIGGEGVGGGGGAACLCHLVRDSSLFGFPLNTTRLLSLFSSCDSSSNASAYAAAFQSLCEGSQDLPPFRSPSGGDLPGTPAPPLLGNDSSDDPGSGSSSSSPASLGSSVAQQRSADASSARPRVIGCSRLLPGIFLLLA